MTTLDDLLTPYLPSRPAPAIPGYKAPAASRPPVVSGTRTRGSTGGGGGGGAASGAAQAKAANRYLQQAAALDGQIRAIKTSLSSSFKRSLDQRLRNIKLAEDQGISALKAGYEARVGSLERAETDNTQAAASASQENLTNRNRERAQLLSEAMSQGAGESDVLRSQQAALNNWNQNQSEVQRSFSDTLSSINAGLTDLNIDTRTGFANVIGAAEGDRDAAWTNLYNQRAEALVNLGNLYGQQAENYGMAGELGKGNEKSRKAGIARSDRAFMDAAHEAAKTYKTPGEPSWLKQWKGQGEFESDIATRNFEQANQAMNRIKAPEGATLRKWE